MRPELSIVIPAYNEEARLGPTLQAVCEYCVGRELAFEILVVDDGSSDGTREIAARYGGHWTRVLVLAENRGKGAAVREGVLAARGDRILVTDADLSTPIADLERLERALAPETVVIGSRRTEASTIVRAQPIFRRWMGECFRWVVRVAGVRGIEDSQCGFKLFDRETAHLLFGNMITEGFAWDVELLWLAQREGFEIFEVGVRWRDSTDSRVQPFRDSVRMLREIVRFRLSHGNAAIRRPKAVQPLTEVASGSRNPRDIKSFSSPRSSHFDWPEYRRRPGSALPIHKRRR